MKPRKLRSAIWCSACCLLMAASGVRAEPFTYQGRLETALTAIPAQGEVTFAFRLFDALQDGSQIGPDVLVDGEVNTGLFTVEVDFGDIDFDGPRFLEVAIAFDGQEEFQTLTPRTPLRATPASIAELNDDWDLTELALTPPVDPDPMEPGTETPPEKYLGVTTPTGPDELAGVFVGTQSAFGMPFFAYAADGLVRALTFAEARTGDWILRLGTSDFVFKPSGDVIVPGTVMAEQYAFEQPVTKYLAIPASAFAPREDEQDFVISNTGLTYLNSGSGNMTAPVMLPDGAEVVAIRLYYLDNSAASDVIIAFQRWDALGFARVELGRVGTNLLPISPDIQSNDDTTIDFPVINNADHIYEISAFCSSWQGSDTAIRGVRIEYTVSSAD